MVASGPLPATDRSATGPPKSITDSKDGTLGRFELLPHQLDIEDIELDIELDIQEELWAPSDAPELEPLKLPSRVAVASLIVPAPLMSAATAATTVFFERLRQLCAAVQKTGQHYRRRRQRATAPTALTAPYRAYGALPRLRRLRRRFLFFILSDTPWGGKPQVAPS